MRKSLITKLDFPLLLLIAILLATGLTAVYSATNVPGLQNNEYFSKQLTFTIIGFIIMLAIAFLPFKVLQRSAYALYGFSIFLLILVLFIGVKGFGAERWLSFGPINIQPSEFAKLAAILAAAKYLSKREVDINNFRHIISVSAIIIIPFILVVRQPDLGTSLVFLAIFIPLMFWAGLSWFTLFVIIAPMFTCILSFNFYAFLFWMLIVSIVLILSHRKVYFLITIFLIHILVGLLTPEMFDQLKPYQQKRILTFANPEADPKGTGYQIIQSRVAIGSGGIWGKGFLQGTQTQLKFLPAQHTDFIFSVIGEEWGLVGVLFVLSIFLALLLYLIYLAGIVRSSFSSISIIGITTILLFHVFINIGMTVGLAPVTGIPLPFISYGGSFLISILIMMGFIINFSINRYEY